MRASMRTGNSLFLTLLLILILLLPSTRTAGSRDIPCFIFSAYNLIIVAEDHTNDAGPISVSYLINKSQDCAIKIPCAFFEISSDLDLLECVKNSCPELKRKTLSVRHSISDIVLDSLRKTGTNPVPVDYPATELRQLYKRGRTLSSEQLRGPEGKAWLSELIVGRNTYMASQIISSKCQKSIFLVGSAHVFSKNNRPIDLFKSEEWQNQSVLSLRAHCAKQSVFEWIQGSPAGDIYVPCEVQPR